MSTICSTDCDQEVIPRGHVWPPCRMLIPNSDLRALRNHSFPLFPQGSGHHVKSPETAPERFGATKSSHGAGDVAFLLKPGPRALPVCEQERGGGD
ncbi:hypothetical protein DPEC_G00149070 [Dallia pectoralis]|uniref:Uncharacterized protein n=1 Tax=Dallia pectoralis TaxID=75939 RepID=A0ACC2GIH9_DALPE|nr:hypothetical protein DPEC_G00149070 [Dallia pectoralis]